MQSIDPNKFKKKLHGVSIGRWASESLQTTNLRTFQVLGSPIAAALLQTDGFLGLSGWQWLFIMVHFPTPPPPPTVPTRSMSLPRFYPVILTRTTTSAELWVKHSKVYPQISYLIHPFGVPLALVLGSTVCA
jgi:hypothetical protein